MLKYLVEHAGRLVTQNELLNALWPNTFVQPEVLKSHILDIRSALGDSPKSPKFIETLPRRGYRFIAPVGDPSAAAAIGTIPPSIKLVGRDSSLAELKDCLNGSLQNHRQIVFVTGEAGIGKTSLVDEFLARAVADFPGARVARGQCVEGYGGKEAYYPFLEGVRQLCAGSAGEAVVEILSTQAPTWLVQFPALVRRDQRETLQSEILGATRERMVREISEAMDTIASEKPLVMVLEDLHWGDPSTVDLISALARRRVPSKLMLIGTYRPVEVALAEHPLKTVKQDLLLHHLCHEILLESLDQDEVAEYLAFKSAGTAVPEGLAELVYRHTEGNPLFMVAALDNMCDRGLIAIENGHWQIKVPVEKIDLETPESLRQMIELQIDRLSKEQQRILEIASVLRKFPLSVTIGAAVSDLEPDDCEELLEGLAKQHQVIRRAGSRDYKSGASSAYEFVHALYRDVLYHRIGPARRRKLHKSVAENAEALHCISEADAAAELAYQFEEGGDWPRAVKYLRLVAETAGRRYAPWEAAAALEHAVELSCKLPDAERAVTETELLEKLAELYVVSFDPRAPETYQALADRAAHYGLIDVEARGLIGMAYPLSWSSAPHCLEVLERALELSHRQTDQLTQARTRASCMVRRVWVRGWDPQDAQEFRNALAEIRQLGDPFVTASHLVDYSVIQWFSSEYREAYQNAVDGADTLLGGHNENLYLSFPHWLGEFIVPWSLLHLGEWGRALGEVDRGISMARKNGDSYRARTLLLYRAWVHFHAMDFAAVRAICEDILPSLGDPPRRPWRRFCLILAGSAKTALGDHDGALKYLLQAQEEMDQLTVIHDWHHRMLLHSALADLWLEKADLLKARTEADRLLALTQVTEKRTLQALAWEVNTRVAVAEQDFEGAQRSIDNALSTVGSVDVPLAAWRVHATAADLYKRRNGGEVAEHHRQISRTAILKLANSLPADGALKKTFLSAPLIRAILGESEISPSRALEA
jgi:tetratricopeptide (TPR) repeat protein